MIAQSVDEVLALFERWGDQHYDEELSQLAHALQTAALARAAGSPDALVAAALLHDVGHLLELAGHGPPEDTTADLRHEARGSAYLAGLFPPAVTAPIALHVRAKRYLVTVDPSYATELSVGSTSSLERQGGPLTREEAVAFERNPGWSDAVALRRWDDEAKDPDRVVADLGTYRALLSSLVVANPAAG